MDYVSLKDKIKMIKCNITACGTIGRDASMRTTKEEKTFLTFPWEYDAETCTYTFHIRDGIQWHDGEKFTADDVKFTIEAIMDPEKRI